MSNLTRKEPYLEQMRTTKGELVQHPKETSIAAKGRELKNNPYKTPPNNLTSKGKETEEKG